MTEPFIECPCRGRRVPRDYCYWEATCGACNDGYRETFAAAYSRAVARTGGANTGAGGTYATITGIATPVYSGPAVTAVSLAGFSFGGSGIYGGTVTQLEPPIEHLPPEVGEVIAWRCWGYDRHRLLRSLTQDYYWPIDEPATGEPEDFNSAGVYALKDREDAEALLRSRDGSTVLGTVRLWGEIVECEHGYRAQFARVNSLDLMMPPCRSHWFHHTLHPNLVLKDLRARYGVSVDD